MKIFVVGLLICGAFVGALWSQSSGDDLPNVAPFMEFWQRMQTKIASGKIDLSKNYEIRIKSSFSNRKVVGGDLNFFVNGSTPELLDTLKDFMSAVDDSNLLRVIALETYGEDIRNADLNIKLDDTDVEFGLVLEANSETAAQNISSRLRMIFTVTARLTEGSPEEQFYRNATIGFEKNKITVNGRITRANFERFLKSL